MGLGVDFGGSSPSGGVNLSSRAWTEGCCKGHFGGDK